MATAVINSGHQRDLVWPVVKLGCPWVLMLVEPLFEELSAWKNMEVGSEIIEGWGWGECRWLCLTQTTTRDVRHKTDIPGVCWLLGVFVKSSVKQWQWAIGMVANVERAWVCSP